MVESVRSVQIEDVTGYEHWLIDDRYPREPCRSLVSFTPSIIAIVPAQYGSEEWTDKRC